MRNYKLDGCFVDDGHRFALIHIYKNASISMRNALGMRGKYYEWNDIKDSDIITVCVIRDPMKRVVSSYQYLLRLEDNGFIEKHPIHVTKETMFFKCKDSPINSFNLFIDYIEKHGFYDAVTLPQTLFLSDRGMTISDVNEVLIQETLDIDFSEFSDKYGLGVSIPYDNVGDNVMSDRLNRYISKDTEIQNRIRNLYKEDFDMYSKFESYV